MCQLDCFEDESFDMVVNPCSNCFVSNVRPVWNEAFRVLKTGGSLMTGFTNPIRYIFDDELLETGQMIVAYKIPYSDLEDLSEEQQKRFAQKNEPLAFGHSLEDQIGGQLDAGFSICNFFEDCYERDDALSQHINTFIATRALKL